MYMHEMAAGKILGSSLSPLKKSHLQYAGPISGLKYKIGVTPMTQHLPATCLSLLPVGWGWLSLSRCPWSLDWPALHHCWQAWAAVCVRSMW